MTRIVRLLFMCSAIIMIASNTSLAQLEISVQGNYEIPLDELKWIYKPGTGALLTISKTDKYKKKRTAFGGNIGFTRFNAKEDIFYYLLNGTDLGTVHYGNYDVYQLSLNYRRDFIINKSFELFMGAEFGYQYANYRYISHDSMIDEDGTTIEGRIGVSPKAGFNFVFSKNVSAFIQSRYTVSLITQPSDKTENIINYFLSTSIGLNFRFE